MHFWGDFEISPLKISRIRSDENEKYGQNTYNYKKIINNKMNDCLSTFNKKNNLLKKWEYDIRKMGYIKIYNDLLFCLFS